MSGRSFDCSRRFGRSTNTNPARMAGLYFLAPRVPARSTTASTKLGRTRRGSLAILAGGARDEVPIAGGCMQRYHGRRHESAPRATATLALGCRIRPLRASTCEGQAHRNPAAQGKFIPESYRPERAQCDSPGQGPASAASAAVALGRWSNDFPKPRKGGIVYALLVAKT